MNYYINEDGDKYYVENNISNIYIERICYTINGITCLTAKNRKNYTPDIIHNADGPAIEWSNGNKYWYCHGKHHRIDGPATEVYNGYKAWFYHGEQIHCKDNEEFLKIIKMKAFL